jgi:glycerophosphoryl diester phosphodiesterase
MCEIAPENTIPAVQAAIDAGIEWVELDVRTTKDGHLVLSHDDNLHKVAGIPGKIKEMSLEEIKAVDAGSWFANRFSGESIPTFKEALQYCKNKININIEPKDAAPETLVKEILEAEMGNQVIVYGNGNYIEQIKKLSGNKIATQTGYNPEKVSFEDLLRLSPSSVEIKANLISPELVSGLQNRGIIVMAQALGENDNKEIWQKCFEAGVDQIITDKPEIALANYLKPIISEKTSAKVSAHRGAKEFAPENTLTAFKKAIDMGVDYIEIDVRLTKDRKQVILHDSKLDRTTNGTGALNEFNYNDIENLSAGKWFGKDYKDEKIPTLEETCILLARENKLRDKKVNFYVDCKDIDPTSLVETLDKYNLMGGAVFYGSHDKLAAIKTRYPEAKLMPGLGDLNHLDDISDLLNPYALDVKWNILSESSIDKIHQKGIKVFSDALGRNEKIEEYQKAMLNGIDAIQTDNILRVYRAIELLK